MKTAFWLHQLSDGCSVSILYCMAMHESSHAVGEHHKEHLLPAKRSCHLSVTCLVQIVESWAGKVMGHAAL